MKAFSIGNGRIKIKMDTDKDRIKCIEDAITKIKHNFSIIKNECENRNTTEFPYMSINIIIKNTKKILECSEGIEVTEEYLERIKETKNVAEYFETRLKDHEKNESIFYLKKQKFKEISKTLENIICEHL